jgi:leucyl-tRNA synthetase
MEHVTRHLIYSRFWHRFLYDIGEVPVPEPYAKRSGLGLVLGADGVKMSKSRGNVVDPDDVIKKYGADTLRTYIMFMSDYSASAPWKESGVKGCKRFLERVASLSDIAEGTGTTKKLESIMNKTVKKVSQDIEDMKFNTAIAAMMTCLNEINDVGTLTKDELSVFIRLLCPFAPHLCEEMWEQLGEEGLCSTAKWPDYDESKCVDDEIEIAVQVNGRVRDRFTVPADIEAADAIARAKELDKVKEFTDGMAFIKELYVPGKLVNLVVKPQ